MRDCRPFSTSTCSLVIATSSASLSITLVATGFSSRGHDSLMGKAAILILLVIVANLAILASAQSSVPSILVVFGDNGGNTSDGSPQVLLDFPSSAEDGQTWPVPFYAGSSFSLGAAAPLLALKPKSLVSGVAFGGLLNETGYLWTWGADYLTGRNYSSSSTPTAIAPSTILFSDRTLASSAGISAVTTTNSATIFVLGQTVYGFGTSNSSSSTGLFGPNITTPATTLKLATALFTFAGTNSTLEDVMCTSVEACSLIVSTASGERTIQTWGAQYGGSSYGVLARLLNDSDTFSSEPAIATFSNTSAACSPIGLLAVTKSCFFARCADSSSIAAWGFNEGEQCSEQDDTDGSLLPTVLTGLQGRSITNLACGETYCFAVTPDLPSWRALAWGQIGGRNFSASDSCSLISANSSIYECKLYPHNTTLDNETSWVDVGISNDGAFLIDSFDRFYQLSLLSSTTLWNITRSEVTLPPFYEVRNVSLLRHARGSLMYTLATVEQSSTECIKPAPYVGDGRNASCIGSVWVSAGSVNVSNIDNAYLPGPTFIFGDYWVNPSLSMSINATTALYDEGAILNVTGCISILGDISVYLEDDVVVNIESGSFTGVLWEGYTNSTCNISGFYTTAAPSSPSPDSSPTSSKREIMELYATPADSPYVGKVSMDANAPLPRCRIVTVSTEVVTDEASGKTKVMIKFGISTDRSCERRDVWWIVLLGVSAIVIVLTAILLITFQCISRSIEKRADKEWDDR